MSSLFVQGLSSTTTASNGKQERRVLCFGDSLTAGTSPPSYQNYPYAPHLEHALKKQQQQEEQTMEPSSTTPIVVRHAGFPGWTSGQLLENRHGPNGLATLIQTIQEPSLSMVILLAGTNDLAYQKEAGPIVESIVALHEHCHNQGVPYTLAIGIPPSAYQSMDSDAHALAAEVNLELERYCQSKSPKNDLRHGSVYVPFPFAYERNGENWSPDGLHFSDKGYQTLGKSLAPIVSKVLYDL